jgi:hypothetical protein
MKKYTNKTGKKATGPHFIFPEICWSIENFNQIKIKGAV